MKPWLCIGSSPAARRALAIIDLVGKAATFERFRFRLVRTELDDWLATAAIDCNFVTVRALGFNRIH